MDTAGRNALTVEAAACMPHFLLHVAEAAGKAAAHCAKPPLRPPYAGRLESVHN
jgi:hypothetical protein